ncbi:MAG: hypothetical protein HY661_16890 [Betaproteobacteria bacterium]|nr:hypothetical protein [Betaproteobacteria bacterium]
MRRLTPSSLVLSIALLGSSASADPEADVRRALIERQQRTDELILRLQQSQRAPTPGNVRLQQELNSLHMKQLQRLQILNARQLRQFDASQLAAPADPSASRMLMLQQQQSYERDRQLELQQFRWEDERVRDRQRQPSVQKTP